MSKSSSCPSYKTEKLRSLCQSPDLADCVFIVNAEKIPAHRLLLACSSPVFEKMLYGKMLSDEILISDIDTEEFKQMLDFVYKDTVHIKSIINAWALVYIADKYLMDDLLQACLGYIEQNLEINTLVLCYECAEIYSQESLKTKCWNDIAKYTRGVIESNYHMKVSTLRNLLQDELLNVDEKDLIIYTGNWAREECRMRGLDLSKENILEILRECDLLNCLRFLAVPQQDYSSFSELFSVQDIYELMLSNNNRCLKKSARNAKMHINSYKFRDTHKISKRIIVTKDDSLSSELVVNHRVAVFGVVVSTEHEPHDAYCRKYKGAFVIQIYKLSPNSAELIAEIDEPFSNLDYDSVTFINFAKLVVLEPHTFYRITVKYKSLRRNSRCEVIYYFLSQTLYMKDNCVIQFSNEFNGSVLRGISFYPA